MSGLSIGDLAARTGLAVSAIRFYETHGIVAPLRNAGGHRRYGRADIRRLSLDRCALYNPADIAAKHGAGPRYLLGDRAPPTSD